MNYGEEPNTSEHTNHSDGAPAYHEDTGTNSDGHQAELQRRDARYRHWGRGRGREERPQPRPRRDSLPPLPIGAQYNNTMSFAELRKRHDDPREYIADMKNRVISQPNWAKREAARITAGMQEMAIGNIETKNQHEKRTGTETAYQGDKRVKDVERDPRSNQGTKRGVWAKQQEDHETREVKRHEESQGTVDGMEID
jgi:hypothetical protein